jgi:hypothetical protein
MFACQIFIADSRNIHMDVNAVHEWTRNLGPIPIDSCVSARALMIGVGKVSARTAVHGCRCPQFRIEIIKTIFVSRSFSPRLSCRLLLIFLLSKLHLSVV